MAEILYAPDRERVVTSNAWAFLHWLRMVHGVELDGWAALHRRSVEQPVALCAAVAALTGFAAQGAPISCLAEAWLHADLRPDDRVLVVGGATPWSLARRQGTSIVRTDPTDPLSTAAGALATVLVAPCQLLTAAAFQHRGRRPQLASLRTIIATGGPMSPEARRRIYTWVKADVLLLARSGNTVWGNPLEPVLAWPPAMPALFASRDLASSS